jgi:acetyl esterase/lipase
MTGSRPFEVPGDRVISSPAAVGQPLDPEYASLLDGFSFEYSAASSLSELRVALPGLGSTAAVERTEHRGLLEPEVPLRIHRPREVDGPLPGVISIHGGGYVLGSYDMDDLRFESWCPDAGVIGISVDYRLAPECPYPGPLEDCYRGFRWAHDNAQELGLDRSRMGVYGVSAGGGLAAALALLLRDRGEMPLAFQLLEAPMLDDRQQTPSSNLDGLAVFSKQSNEFCWRAYLGEGYGGLDVPYYAAPARVTNLSGLPPSFISVGAVDGFRDESIDYGLRLNQAGVATELHVYPGAPHGFQMFVDSRVARQAQRDSDNWLARVVREAT